MDKLPEAEQEEFKAKSQGAMKLLLGNNMAGALWAPPPPPPPPGRPGLRPR